MAKKPSLPNTSGWPGRVASLPRSPRRAQRGGGEAGGAEVRAQQDGRREEGVRRGAASLSQSKGRRCEARGRHPLLVKFKENIEEICLQER